MRFLFLISLLLLPGCRLFHREAHAADGRTVTQEEFSSLKWLEGKWEGTGSDSIQLRVTYTFQDDSTIKSSTWADTGYTRISDSSFITLRQGAVTAGGGDVRWVLTRWDRFGLHFEPRGKALEAFVWRPVDGYTWIATRTWIDAAGKRQERVYTMRRWQL